MALKPSERATLIKEVAKRLAAQEEDSYAFIDMTLKTFGLPISDTWNGSVHSYVLEMVQKGSDESILRRMLY